MEFCWVPMILLVCYGYLSSSSLVQSGLAVDSLQYTVVHSESDFEIRLYGESSWATALVRGNSFQNSTKLGFHRLPYRTMLYQYIHGANVNSIRFTITAPILTSVIIPQTNGSIYLVRTYITAKSPPQPNPELNLQIDKWRSHCVAVRNFPGFARDDNVEKEVEALVSSLNKHLTGTTTIIQERSSYTVAQYNASHHLTGRLNQVWINVTVLGCPY
ncbi:hypothetical protein Ddye_031335 [Dipteronia dyeriana]|uniref:SOUL heme-binding protein n=1 Tax=Dipteronia dyeriana TaxID=168575 RepID=A0AAD9WNK6_9ROSI|nr:hypothetical protein Ddye_031335 [Dipteronia dyeriana]